MTEYKSFFKTVGGNEGSKCKYSTRLDVYGRGCQHDCDYCYAKSLLSFRGLWDAEHPAEDLKAAERNDHSHGRHDGLLSASGAETETCV
jgi:organic radical activating enzyme